MKNLLRKTLNFDEEILMKHKIYLITLGAHLRKDGY